MKLTFSAGARFLANGGRGGVAPPRNALVDDRLETTDRRIKGASAREADAIVRILYTETRGFGDFYIPIEAWYCSSILYGSQI